MKELRESCPVFEFFHSNGLSAVQKPGGPKADNFVSLVFDPDAPQSCAIRSYYEAFADHLEHQLEKSRQAHAIADINTHLYWRGSDQPFTEPESIRAANTLEAKPSQVFLPLGRAGNDCDQIRIDLTDTVAQIKLHSLIGGLRQWRHRVEHVHR